MTSSFKTAVLNSTSRRKSLRKKFRYRLANPTRFLLDLATVKLRARKAANYQPIRILLVSDVLAPTSEEQFNLFSLYRSELRDDLKLVTMHMLLSDVLRLSKRLLKHFDILILKMSFQTRQKDALNIVRSIRGKLEHQRLIYFDGDDDLCVQWPEILSHVDLYVKKHLFRDRSQYLKRFVGKSNLTDFVNRRYNQSFGTIRSQHTAVPFLNRKSSN